MHFYYSIPSVVMLNQIFIISYMRYCKYFPDNSPASGHTISYTACLIYGVENIVMVQKDWSFLPELEILCGV